MAESETLQHTMSAGAPLVPLGPWKYQIPYQCCLTAAPPLSIRRKAADDGVKKLKYTEKKRLLFIHGNVTANCQST